MSPTVHRIALIGLLACAIVPGRNLSALGLFDRFAEASPSAVPQWPVLRSATQSVLGLYGGIVSAYNLSGQLESATLLILPTGYTAPVLSSGAVATFPLAYFDQPGCKGREHLPVSGDNGPGLLPFPGVVYRSAASGQTVYVPQGRQPASVTIRSALHLDAQGIRCEPLQQSLTLLAVEPNAPAVTGMNRDGDVGPVTLGIESAAGMAGKRDRRSSPGALPENAGAAEPLEQPQEECSPGCLAEAVGNGSCDIPCYFEACGYDGGDCTTMNKDELDAALANMCSPGCNQGDIGDGFCDAACQTDACNQDGGDCAAGN
jgi:hypothetical protein